MGNFGVAPNPSCGEAKIMYASHIEHTEGQSIFLMIKPASVLVWTFSTPIATLATGIRPLICYQLFVARKMS